MLKRKEKVDKFQIKIKPVCVSWIDSTLWHEQHFETHDSKVEKKWGVEKHLGHCFSVHIQHYKTC